MVPGSKSPTGKRRAYYFKTEKEAAEFCLQVKKAAQAPGRSWLIWSQEHGAWWAPFRLGYTRDLNCAGRYSFQEATRICAEANRYQVQEIILAAHK